MDSRAAFEAWHKSEFAANNYPYETDSDGDYTVGGVQADWIAWQARDAEVEALRATLLSVAQASANVECNQAPRETLSAIHVAAKAALAAGREE